jgi:toluene monooxygenase system ferredoxin subunit
VTGWHDAYDEAELWEDDMVGVKVAGEPVLLIRDAGGVRAFRDKCPHQDNPLSDGLLEGDTLTCAFHMWIFDTVTGESINPTDECLTAHQCRIEGDKIQVKFKGPDD